MVFSSLPFIFIFLPITLIVFYFLAKHIHHYAGISWLIVASLIFYGYWNVNYVPLILVSIFFNYFSARAITAASIKTERTRKILLVIAVAGDLSLLGFYKYTDFFISNINSAMHAHLSLPNIILPLGISFYTFTQIAYLVDSYRSRNSERNLLNYGLFVSIFPHLIAGPIIHHHDIIPQFKNKINFSYENFSVGMSIFCIGLIKKTLFADHIGYIADTLFTASASHHLSFFEAWGGAMAYTFQIYFDFSGYADMAIGLARMLGITFPANFNSPYKALSIIDFWRRWHMTLSSFLKNYLYIPLGGNRKGEFRRYINIMLTMFLGGLWHGAGWTFVIWGAAHGIFLVINHLWRKVFKPSSFQGNQVTKIIAWALTFLGVVTTWVLFRADNFTEAQSILISMFDVKPLIHSQFSFAALFPTPVYVYWPHRLLEYAVLLFIVIGLPNSQQIMSYYRPVLSPVICDQNSGLLKFVRWQPNAINLAVYASFFILSVMIIFIGFTHDFIYFQF